MPLLKNSKQAMSRTEKADRPTIGARSVRAKNAAGNESKRSAERGIETAIAVIGQALASDPRLISALQSALGQTDRQPRSERILRLPEVRTRTGLSRSAIYAKITQGRFPAPKKLGVKMVGWYESQIAQWIADPR